MTEHSPIIENSGVGGDMRHQRRDDRDTLAAWRSRMQQGKESVLEWLDEQEEDEDSPGYARALLQLRHSTDDRVKLGALKIEGELREWLGARSKEATTVNIDARSQSVNVQLAPTDLSGWLADVSKRLTARNGADDES